MTIYWGLLFFVLIFVEFVTVNLVSIWFAMGAISAMVVSLFTNSIFIQLVIFIIVSIISLILTKPIVEKITNKKVEPTNLDRVIGKTGIVTKKITVDNYGEVKVLGTIWTAVSDENLDEKDKVIIKKIDGVKLVVSKKEEEK